MRKYLPLLALAVSLALTSGARAEEPSESHCGGKTARQWAKVVADHKGTNKAKPTPEVTRAFLALERIGATGEEAIPILADILKSAAYPNTSYRGVVAILAVHSSDKATAALAAAALSPIEGTRDAVLAHHPVWSRDPVPPELVAAAAKLLSDPKDLVAASAARCLENAGRSAKPALPELRKALSRDFAREHIVKTLLALGQPALVALPDLDAEIARLERLSKDPKEKRRSTELAIEARKLRDGRDKLAAVEKHKDRTLAEWQKALESKVPAERIEVFAALDALRVEESVRRDAAVKLLADQERDVRHAAFRVIRRYKFSPRRLHPQAAKAMTDYVGSLALDQERGDGLHWQELTGALAEVSGPDSVPVLIRLAQAGNDWGVNGLGRVGPGALPAAELLASLMAGEKNRMLMRQWAAEAFVKLGPLDAATSEKVVPNLLVALRITGDDHENHARFVIRSSALAGLHACAALPADVETKVAETITAQKEEQIVWKRDLVQLLAERFPKKAVEFKELLLGVRETPRGAALVAEVLPEPTGLTVWVMERLKAEAERIDTEGKSKCAHNPDDMAWLLRAARALKAGPPFQLSAERALWANDASTRDAARKTLAVLQAK